MFNLFKKKETEEKNNLSLIAVASLLIHAAKIDQNFTDKENIEKRINTGKDIFGRDITYRKVQIDNSFPKYIIENQEKLKEWII